MEKIEGVYIIDKPLGMSSQRAVQVVKYWAREKTGNKKIKVGHAGTLDPLATGVLIVAVGREYTKNIDTIVAAHKMYDAKIHLGETSTTDDAEGEKTIHEFSHIPSRTDIENVLCTFVGDIAQIPPKYSAIKIGGKEAYKRVRRGEVVEMQSRIVHIDTIEIIEYAYPLLHVRVACGKGTYIRSLARDIGNALGTGAYLSGLVRTSVGDFVITHAQSLDDFECEKL